MRVAHVIHEYLPEATAGSTLHLRDLAQAQRARGHEVRVFVRAGDSGREPFSLATDEVQGLPVTRMAYDFHDVERFGTLFRSEQMDEVFGQWLARERVEIVHFHHLSCLASSMIEAAKRRELRCVMTLQDYWMQCGWGTRFHPRDQSICTELDRDRCVDCMRDRWPHLLPGRAPLDRVLRRFAPRWVTARKLRWWDAYQREQLRLLDAWIAPSTFVREEFAAWGLDAKRGAVVANGIRTAELRAEPRGPHPIRRIGYLGRVVPNKGVHLLLDAFARLRGQDLSLEIHGEVPDAHSGDGYGPEFFERAARPGVTLHGRFESEELPQILTGLDCLVVPSVWWEPFGIVAREGALAGIPVVVSEVAGLADAVDAGTALGFPLNDGAQLTNQLQRLIDDPELRDRMSRTGERVPDIEDSARAVLEVYERVLCDRTEFCDIQCRESQRPDETATHS